MEKEYKTNITLSLNMNLVKNLDDFLSKKNISRSEFIEELIKKEIKK